ncbi:MAG: DUF1320 family protein [Puniceicoccales bacterium]|jgi:hypothetical protein|nr:DUF1320 family protein [Puniceicoccales bacterium]
MPWISLTVDDVARKVAGAELEALRGAALGSGQPDPLPGLIADAVDKIRGYAGACSRNRLGPPGTIPHQLVDAALVLIRNSALNRLPVDFLNTAPRQKEYDDAMALLHDLAACKFSIETPDAPVEPPAEMLSTPATSCVRPRPLSRQSRNSDGL